MLLAQEKKNNMFNKKKKKNSIEIVQRLILNPIMILFYFHFICSAFDIFMPRQALSTQGKFSLIS